LDVTLRRLIVPYCRFGTTYRSLLQGPSHPVFLHCSTLEDGTENLSRNGGNELPIYAA